MDDTCETPSRMLGNRLRRLQLKVKSDIALIQNCVDMDASQGGQPLDKSVHPILK